ncbi:MAG: trypsin-like serine protease [Phycisphaerae bacterium]
MEATDMPDPENMTGADGEQYRRHPTPRSQAVSLLSVVVLLCASAGATPPADTRLEARTLLTTYGDPSGYVTSPGGAYDGVVKLTVTGEEGSFLGSGSLISDRYVLTAAHLLDLNDDGMADVTPENTQVLFNLSTGTQTLTAVSRDIHSQYDPGSWWSNDIGIIELERAAPAAATRYEIYRGSGESGATVELAGYGRSGTGDEGDVLSSGTKRAGLNQIDDINTFDGNGGDDIPDGTQLNMDFDNGLAANDAFDFFYDMPGLGLGEDEVFIAPGDSGGPSFIGGQVAGVHSYGVRMSNRLGKPPRNSDINGSLDASFGEFASDTRVSAYQAWIDYYIAALPGDADRNGLVDLADFATLEGNWDPQGYGYGWADGDFDADSAVGNADLAAVLSNWTAAPLAASVPEPATLVTLTGGALVLLRSRRRHLSR